MKSRKTAACALAGILAFAVVAHASTELEAARGLAAQGDPAAALSLVEEQLEADADLPEGLFLKGVLLVELRRAEEAREVFERLIEVEPNLPEPYNNLAVIQAAAGDYEAAVQTLRRSLETHASYRTAYDNLTKIYTQLASEAYSEALDSQPEERAEIVELVLLGNLGQLPVGRPGDTGEPRPEAQLAATEPAAAARGGAQMPSSPAVADEPATESEAELDEAAVAEPSPSAEAHENGPDVDGVAQAVEAWRSAWQEQRVDDYLAAYSARFRPPDGLSRAQWAEQRRDRLSAPTFIRVTLAYLDEPQVIGDKASIRFLQSYESNTFQDRVSKLLVLVWEDGGWKILEERAD